MIDVLGSAFIRGSRWTLRVVAWLFLALLGFAVVVAALFQFWLLPNINSYREDIAAAVTQATGVQIAIGEMEGAWRDWRPAVTLRKVRVKDVAGQDALTLDEIRSEVAWKSLLLGEIRLHVLEISRLAIEVRRDKEGRVFVAGIALVSEQSPQHGLGDWLLRQDSVRLAESSLRWIDEKTGATPLELAAVELEVGHRFGIHSIDLKAAPPLMFAAPFWAHGELKGDTLGELVAWDGVVEFKFPYINLGEVNRNWQLIKTIERAAGGIDARIEFERGALTKLRANVTLANVTGRWSAELEPLQLSRLQGGIDYAGDSRNLEVRLRDLSFTTVDNLAQTGLNGQFSRRVLEGGAVETKLAFNFLDLVPVARIASRLPLSHDIRQRIAALDPRGSLSELKLNARELGGQVDRYDVSSRFDGLALNALEVFPGFGGASGSLKASHKGGTLDLKGRGGWVHLPRVFATPIALDQVDARLNWVMKESGPELKFQELTLANPEFAAKVSGSYQAIRGAPGIANLQATLTRADAGAVWRYIPLVVPEAVRHWLQQSIVAGHFREASILLRGDLRNFPFDHGRTGEFEVRAKAQGGMLAYAPGWPVLQDITCDLLFRGDQIEISAGKGRVFSALLSKVAVSIPELRSQDPIISIRGEAAGPASEFLRFLAESPLVTSARDLTSALKVQGGGDLSLAFDLPLRHMKDAKVVGSYRFTDNLVALPAGLGELSRFNGVLHISEKGVNIQGATGNFLGGSVRVDAKSSQSSHFEVNASGRVSGGALGQLTRLGWDRYLGGSTDWRARFSLGPEAHAFIIESNLQGLVSQLPAPLGKTASETLALRIERGLHASGLAAFRLELGERFSARYLAAKEQALDIKGGEIVFGGMAQESERDVLRLSGRLPSFDWDAWRNLWSGGSALMRERTMHLPTIWLQGLQVDRLSIFSRDFGAVSLSGKKRDHDAQLVVDGRAANGEVNWAGNGVGQLNLKLARLYVPAGPSGGKVAADPSALDSLPGVQAEVQDFRLNERELGKLVLSAVPEGRLWRLQRLELTSPEYHAQIQGSYDLRAPGPRTALDVKLEVSDIGAYFVRMKLPPGIKKGKAKLEGKVQWAGAPFAFDLASLTGHLQLDAKQGQFARIEPGVGKLLGVLSLQALPRRLTLDFRDVFSQGFAFNQISATSDLNAGIASTKDFKMQGPSATVDLRGNVDLIKETQNLNVRVLPGLSDSLTVAGAIVNPAIGVAAYLAQKVLRDPVDKLFASEYQVTGTWVDPTVTKKTSEPSVSKSRR